MRKLKKAPKIKTDEEAHDFWSRHDSSDYVDWTQAQGALFPNLRPTSQSISIRFPVAILDRIKMMAAKQDIPYQSLIKIFINKAIRREMRPHL